MSQAQQRPQSPARSGPYRIFISSTSVDLQAHRLSAHDTIERLKQFPIDMAQFGAHGDGDARTVSLDEVAQADIFIVIVAWRYGTILPGQVHSITHLEYLAALDHKLPIFAYLADEATRDADGPDALFPAATRNLDHWQQLLAFRAELQRSDLRVCDTFTTHDNLGRKLGPAISNYLLELQRKEQAQGAPRIPWNLPPVPPGFVGRERELDELCTRLRAGTSVGLSAAVSGMAGVGKSALAAQALHRLANETPAAFPGGITWVACNERSGTTGLAWVYDQVLAAWDAPLSRKEAAQADGDADPALAREQALQRHVAVQQQGGGQNDAAGGHGHTAKLALLDNVEETLPLARALTILGSVGITTLVTARHRPMLPALSLLALDTLEREPDTAVTLFAERYTQAGGNWDATRDIATTQHIADLLGYLPLAIELEAARAANEGIPLNALAAEEREADRLGRMRNALDPARSVRYAFERSVATLSDEERHCFIALGMLALPDAPRSLVLDMCAYLVVQTDQDEEDARPRQWEQAADACLAALSARSLIAQRVDADETTASLPVPGVSGERGDANSRTGADAASRPTQATRRIRVHPLLHEFAQAAWTATGMRQRTADVIALLGASIRYSEFASAGGAGGATHGRFAALERDETLLVSALRLTQQVLAHPKDEVKDVTADAPGAAANPVAEAHTTLMSLSIRLVDALQEYIDLGGHWRLGVDLRLYQLRLRREVGDRGGEGTTLNNLGRVADDLGRKQEALDYYQQALAVLRAVGDRRGEGAALNNLGLLANSLGHLQEAFDYYQQALAIRQEVGDRRGEGVTLSNLGLLADSLGRKQEALDYYQQALAISREVDDRRVEGTTFNNLGGVADSLGRKQEALDYFEQALAILRAVGDRRVEGITLNSLGGVADDLGRKQEALDYYQQALVIRREVGDRSGEGTTLNNLGYLANSLGRRQEALDYYQQALVIRREVGDRSGEGTTLNNLGRVADDLGRKQEALDYYQQALAIIENIGLPRESEIIRGNIASVLASLEATEEEQTTSTAQRRWRWPWQR